MTTRTKMTAPERRQAIVEASRPLFAQNGFRGTAVRDIARAANVSEALLYKHFASKEEIYEDVMDYAGRVSASGIRKLKDLEAGTEALVVRIYVLVRVILLEVPTLRDEQHLHERMLYRSLLGDTKFARTHFRGLRSLVEEAIGTCLVEAGEAGDLVAVPIGNLNRMWFVHHLAMALNFCHLSGEPAFEYEGSKEDLVEQVVLFCLRGIGMTEAAIERYFLPGRLKEIFDHLHE
jgi:AcrR family transcriptional regulator